MTLEVQFRTSESSQKRILLDSVRSLVLRKPAAKRQRHAWRTDALSSI